MAQVTSEMLLKQFQKFKEDDTQLKLLEAQGLNLRLPGFIVEMFVFDITKDMDVKMPEYYIRHTSIAKVLAVCPGNKDIDSIKDIVVGDLIHMGDHLSVMKLNEDWENWEKEKLNPQVEKREQPVKFIKGFYKLLSEGRLYVTQRGNSLISGKHLRFGEKEVRDFAGPFVAFIDPGDVVGTIKDPFVDLTMFQEDLSAPKESAEVIETEKVEAHGVGG